MILCKFRFQCDKTWMELKIIQGEDAVRFCEACVQPVFLCNTFDDVQTHTAKSRCIAVRGPGGKTSESVEHGEDRYLLGNIELGEDGDEFDVDEAYASNEKEAKQSTYSSSNAAYLEFLEDQRSPFCSNCGGTGGPKGSCSVCGGSGFA